MKRKVPVVLLFAIIVLTSQAQEKVTLETVISAALEKNYDVLLSKNNASTTSIDNNNAFGAFLPQFNATGTASGNNPNQVLQFKDATRNQEGATKQNSASAVLTMNWVLFDGTKMFATKARVAAIASQGELLVKDQMVNTISSIIVNYYNVVRQKQQLNATRELMAVNEERVKLADRKLSVGIGAKPELLQAKVDLNAQRTQVLQQETAISILKEQLNTQTGMSLPAGYDVSDSIMIDLNLKLEDISENIEQTNFTLLSSKWNMIIAEKTLRERRAGIFPTLSVNANYGYTKTNNTILLNPFGTILFQSSGLTNYGATLSVPLFNSLNNRRLIQQGKMGVDRQQLLFDQQKLTVNMNIKNAFTNYENAKKVLLVEEENILLAKENVHIALESFKRGVSTFIELRTAQQSLADAYNRLIAARYNAKTSETELLRLKGTLLK
jgi:outer membrane protein